MYILMYVCMYVVYIMHICTSADLVTIDNNELVNEDVVAAFTYLFRKLIKLFSKVNFSELKSVCMLRGAPLPQEFKQKIKAAEKLDHIFDVLDNPMYCNWLNIRLLKMIAANIDNKQAKEIIQIYENHHYSRKASDVIKHFSACCDGKTVSRIKVEINKDYKNVKVKDIINYCVELEKIMDIDANTTTAIDSSPGCLNITIVIPLHCSLHAYKIIKKRFYKLRQMHIQYLEIESFPKVFALNIGINEDTLASLSKNVLKCKFLKR